MQTIAELLAQELGASPVHVQNVIDLLDQGCLLYTSDAADD